MEAEVYQISAPHYVAGLLTSNDIVVSAAPILNWALGRTIRNIKSYCKFKGYEIAKVEVKEHDAFAEAVQDFGSLQSMN